MSTYPPYLSVVVPLFNESGNIGALCQQLLAVLEPLDISYEVLLIDDGSSDDSWLHIQTLSKQHAPVQGLRLARNFGHQHALLAGLSKAQGQAIVSMDGDLQHPPELIPELITQHRAGYKVVNTQRQDQQVNSWFKRHSSAVFYKLFSFLTDVPMQAGASDFRLIDRQVLQQLLKFQDVDIFLRGAVQWLGFDSTTVPFTVQQRFAGDSKYSLGRMLNFARGSMVSFSTKPLVIGIWIGIFTSVLAFLELVYIICQVLSGNTVPGWASTVGIISFLFGILFVILGIIGSYLARIHVALQNRPSFVIADTTVECSE